VHLQFFVISSTMWTSEDSKLANTCPFYSPPGAAPHLLSRSSPPQTGEAEARSGLPVHQENADEAASETQSMIQGGVLKEHLVIYSMARQQVSLMCTQLQLHYWFTEQHSCPHNGYHLIDFPALTFHGMMAVNPGLSAVAPCA
jgi:hypothetical protein